MRIKEQRDLGQCNTILYIVVHVTQQICRMRRQDGGVIESRQPWRKDAPAPWNRSLRLLWQCVENLWFAVDVVRILMFD